MADNHYMDFLLAGLSTAASRTATAPLHRLQALLQTNHELVKNGRLTTSFSGVFDCVKRSVKTEGVSGMWRGNLVHVLSFVPSQFSVFFLKTFFSQYVKNLVPKEEETNKTKKIATGFLAGGLAGATSYLINHPFNYIRLRMMTNVGPKSGVQFKGIIDVCKQTMKSDGIRGFYRGIFPTISSNFLYRGFYFGIYDSTKNLKTHYLGNNLLGNFIYAYGVTISSAMLLYPLGTISKSMMLRSCEPEKYRNSFSAGIQIIKNHGIRRLWGGAGVQIFTSFAGAFALFVYDEFIMTSALGKNI